MTTTDEPKPPSLSALARGNNMITIDVGAEHERYNVYAELISYYSGYFKGILNGPWKEAEDRVIELPDIEPCVFNIFIDWLYTQRLPKAKRDWIAPTPELEAGSHSHSLFVERLMMKAYVFADRFLVTKMRVAIYNYFANFCNNAGIPPYYDAIIYAFNNLPPTNAMLTLLVRTHCAYWTEKSDTPDNGELELRQDLPHDFYLRMMVIFSKMRDTSTAKGIACCDCHNGTAETEREGCDICMPLPEVKQEESPEAGAQANAIPTDGSDQANIAPVNSQDQTNTTPTNGNDQVTQANVVPVNDDDHTYPTADEADQANQNVENDQLDEAINQANQDNGHAAQADQGNQDGFDNGQVNSNTGDTGSVEIIADLTGVAIDISGVNVAEEDASPSNDSNEATTHTGGAQILGDGTAPNFETR